MLVMVAMLLLVVADMWFVGGWQVVVEIVRGV